MNEVMASKGLQNHFRVASFEVNIGVPVFYFMERK